MTHTADREMEGKVLPDDRFPSRVRRSNRTPLLILPAMAYLTLIYAVPLVFLLISSVYTPDKGISFSTYVQFFSQPFSYVVIRNTLWIGVLVTFFAVLIGYPTAFALARARGAVQILLVVALILPLSVGVIVKAFSWQILLRRDGAINQTMEILGLIDQPVRLLFTETGLVIGALNVFLPFMVLPIYSVVKLIDPRLNDAATTLGAGPIYRFVHVTLPLSMPGVITGIAFVFSMSISMYVIPTLLIGDRFQTLATLTGRSFLFFRDQALGSTTAVILLVMALTVIIATNFLVRKQGQSA